MMHQYTLRKIKLSTIINNTHLISGTSHIFRRLLTTKQPPTIHHKFKKNNLYQRLSFLWSTNEKISDVLDEFFRNNSKHLNKYYLFNCIKKFRNKGNFQHCLEILEWMEKGKIGRSNHDLRLNIIYKVKGISEAEKYFNCLPPDVVKSTTYGVLLNCYCSEKMTDKALTVFGKMDEMNYASNMAVFTNLMCLYINVDQPEKVPPLVEEMKRRNIPLSVVSYQTWVQSYILLNDLDGVERVMDDVQKQKFRADITNEWAIYSSFASAYIKAGQYKKVKTSLQKMEELLSVSAYADRIAYHFLITLYASVGDLESVVRSWEKLKSNYKALSNTSYLRMLEAHYQSWAILSI